MTQRCCCGILSNKTGAKIVASMMMVYDIISIVFVFVAPAIHLPPISEADTSNLFGKISAFTLDFIVRLQEKGSTIKIMLTFATVLDLITTVFVFTACRRNRSVLVVPMLIITVLWMVAHAVNLVFCTIVLIEPDLMKNLKPNSKNNGYSIKIETLIAVVHLVFFTWIFTVLKDCYIHLRHIERPRRRLREETERTTRF